MKNIVLSVIVVSALVVAGIGGTLATWSDSEVSKDNIITTGSLDLKVNGQDDAPWGSGVPSKVSIGCMIPEKWYGPYEVELWNAGNCTFDSHAYIHVKKLLCENMEPKAGGYNDPDTGTGDYVPSPSLLKPEPELVAEYGGKVDCVTVDGIGPEGDDCSMTSHVIMNITTSTVGPTTEKLCGDEMGKYLCKEIYLFDLTPCEPKTIYLWFKLSQDTEEKWGYNYIKSPAELGILPGDPGYGEALQYWKKFNDWPSWAMMADRLTFDMEFDLWLEDTPGAIVRPE
jgi:predicted ribosomally synthesized peptide with SipW-like signal peptide